MIEIPRGAPERTNRRAGPSTGLLSRHDSPRDHRDGPASDSVGISSVDPAASTTPEAVVSQDQIYDPRTGTVVQQKILHMPSRLTVANPGWWAGIPAAKAPEMKEVQADSEKPDDEKPVAAEEPAAQEPAKDAAEKPEHTPTPRR